MPLRMVVHTPRGARRAISFCESGDLREIIDTMYEGATLETHAGPVTPEAAVALASKGKLASPVTLTGPGVARARRDDELERLAGAFSAGCAALTAMYLAAPGAGPRIWGILAATVAAVAGCRASLPCGCAWGAIAALCVCSPLQIAWRALVATRAPECCSGTVCDPVCACGVSASRVWCSDIGYNASGLHVCDEVVGTVEQIAMYAVGGVLATLIAERHVGRGLVLSLWLAAAVRLGVAFRVGVVRSCYTGAFTSL